MAALCSLLSVAARTDAITVTLASPTGRYPVRFGYLYELNAGFFYLVIAPLFALCSTVVIRRLQIALVHLHMRRRLVLLDFRGQPKAQSALVFIAQQNHRIFRAPVLATLIIVPGIVVVGTEFNPWTGGDYQNAAFGYIQAPAIPHYLTRFPNLASLNRHRHINELPKLNEQTPTITAESYRLWSISRVDGCPNTKPELMCYWAFVTVALVLQVLFIAFALWTSLKLLLACWLFYIGFDRDSLRRPGLGVVLDFADPENAFGLAGITRVYLPLLSVMALALLGKASSYATNVAKGSVAQLDTIGYFGQTSNFLLPILAFFGIGLYALLVYVRVDAARDRYAMALETDHANRSVARGSMVEELRAIAFKQSLLPEDQFKAATALLGALLLVLKPAYIVAVLAEWNHLMHYQR